MAQRTNFCEVVVGESLEYRVRRNYPVNITDQSNLKSGRVFHINNSGEAVLGGTAGNLLLVAHRGVDCADVAGASTILSTLTGDLMSPTAGYGVVSGIPIRDGLEIWTTEYTGPNHTWAVGQFVGVVTAGDYKGCFINEDVAGNEFTSVAYYAVGQVLQTPTERNGLNMIKIALRTPR